ncbi:hypothetical protein G6O67_005292 [Ophiocordyceps sinensis]|uniref:Uncharacterized protein n=1 Tax=Ophiocordyceps sinensis TaxID=72228 RepID=A0A8H4PR77_9HYPO|nr:hypothetical protein G6O67_005292 [Ophiocordyceps sinensis]
MVSSLVASSAFASWNKRKQPSKRKCADNSKEKRLKLARVNAPGVNGHVKIKAVNITTAKIARAYTIWTAYASNDKRVDFCLCIKSSGGSPANIAMYRVGHVSRHPGGSPRLYQPYRLRTPLRSELANEL